MRKAAVFIVAGFLLGMAAFASWWLFTSEKPRQAIMFPPEEPEYVRYTIHRGAIRDEMAFKGTVLSYDDALTTDEFLSSDLTMYCTSGMSVAKGQKLYRLKGRDFNASFDLFLVSSRRHGKYTVLTFLNLEKTYISTFIPVDVLSRLKEYDSVSVVSDSIEKAGMLEYVSPETVSVDGVLSVEIRISCVSSWLLNTPVKVIFTGASFDDVLIIDEAAVFRMDLFSFLKRLNPDGTVEEIRIRTGCSDSAGMVHVIADGIEPGDVFLMEVREMR